MCRARSNPNHNQSTLIITFPFSFLMSGEHRPATTLSLFIINLGIQSFFYAGTSVHDLVFMKSLRPTLPPVFQLLLDCPAPSFAQFYIYTLIAPEMLVPMAGRSLPGEMEVIERISILPSDCPQFCSPFPQQHGSRPAKGDIQESQKTIPPTVA